MSKNSSVNAKIARPAVGSKRIEKPIKIERPPTKNEEIKEKAKNTTLASSSKKPVAVTATKKITSKQETLVARPTQVNAKTVLSSKPKQTTPISTSIKPKLSATATTNKAIRPQPMRAIHEVQVKKPIAEKNVMNTVHNVTVASPPPVRKDKGTAELSVETLPTEREKRNPVPRVETLPREQERIHPQASTDTLKRERTRTRTLGPDEAILLKRSQSDQEAKKLSDSSSAATQKVEPKPVIIQEPVAFEITFEKPVERPTIHSGSNVQQEISDGDYEDDFDSYESDFETESSTSSRIASSTSSKSEEVSKSVSSTRTESPQVFSAVRKLDDDREFDSGTYELKGVAEKVQLDSIDERELHSDGQNDSGFGYNNATPSPIDQSNSMSSSLFSKPPLIKPAYNKRGMELMKKINLDTMTFTLFELKPLSYDLYMKIYGHKNTNQSSSQTMGNMIDQDAQTDTKAQQTMWTQYPPNFVTNEASTDNYYHDRIGCGEGVEDVAAAPNGEEYLLENSLKIINRPNALRDVRSTKPIDFDRLNFFLQKSAITISAICDTSVASKDLQKSDSTFSDGFYSITTNASEMLKDTSVYCMYSNPNIENILYLAHRPRSPARTHDNSFVSVWNILDAKKPIHLLSCWSLIICLEVHPNFQDVVIGGLTDGCVAVWNFNESTTYSNPETLPPTQIVSPSVGTKPISFDFGCIISLKSVHSMNRIHEDDFKLTQICSLHEFGILTVWTILSTNSHRTNLETLNERKIDHRSPWSKIQLVQSGIIDVASMNLNKKIRPKSGFEKKKMYFESNLFSDAALRELHDFDSQKDLLDQSETFRCVDMECHEDGIVVATNKSFLIFVSTTLNANSLRKICIDDSNLLHATKLKSLDDVLLVGLTDGSVKVLRVKSPNVCRQSNDKDSDTNPAGVPFEQNSFSAKSCAIQNIIKEERKFFDGGMGKDRVKRIEHVIDEPSTVRGNRFINNQILLPAMSSNRDFVRWMDASVNLNSLMSLCGERFRIINFQNSIEERFTDGHGDISFATIVLGYNHREYLVNLEGDSVRVHLLRKKTL